MKTFVAFLLAAWIAAAGVLVVAGSAEADGFVCASGAADWWEPNYLPGYGTKAIGPNSSHQAQWSSDNPYDAWRKNPADGSYTYYSSGHNGGFTSPHWPENNYRWTGMKNINGARSGWFMAHWC